MDGIPTATVARALFDYGAAVGVKRLATAVDAALAGWKVTIGELEGVLDDLAERGHAGTANLSAPCSPSTFRGTGLPRALSKVPSSSSSIGTACRHPIVRSIPTGYSTTTSGPTSFGLPRGSSSRPTAAHSTTVRVTGHATERRDRALERGGWTVLRFGWNDVLHRPTSVRAIFRRALGHRPTDRRIRRAFW